MNGQTELRQLAQPMGAGFVETVDKGTYKANYINHAIITQRALSVVGPFSFEVVRLIDGNIDEYTDNNNKTYLARVGVLGALCKLTVLIDNREVTITEVGSIDIPAMQNDAENAKDATSDAFKRCWMRTGLGLEMWVKDPKKYFLPKQLDANAEALAELGGAGSDQSPQPDPEEGA